MLSSVSSSSAVRRSHKKRTLAVESLEDRRLLAVDVHLLKDLTGNAEGSFPNSITPVGDQIFFTARTAAAGNELWRSNGTPAGTVRVKDIRPGSAGSYPSSLANVNGTLYFSANDGVRGAELWKSDGTAAGTKLVKEINRISSGSRPESLTNVSGTLFFSAFNGSSRELWKSDGTGSGTVMVRNIGAGDSNPTELANVDGTLYFQADDGFRGAEPWRSDGTAAGTRIVSDLTPGRAGSQPTQFTNLNGVAFFRADFGGELWKTRGTAASTVRVHASNGRPIDELTNFQGTLFFTADNGSRTRLMRCFPNSVNATGFFNADVNGLSEFNGELFFAADDGDTGLELWKTNGTLQGIQLVKDIRPQETYYGAPIDSAPRELTNVNGTLFFTAIDSIAGGHGRELWVSDGTRVGTTLVHDIAPGSDSGGPVHLTNANGTLYFAAWTPTNGNELWTNKVNVAPTIALPSGTASYRENNAARVLDGSAIVTDRDAKTFKSARLTVQIRQDTASIDDRLSIARVSNEPGRVNISGSKVLYGGKTIGAFTTGQSGRTLTVTFNSAATRAGVQAVTRRIAFRTLGDDPSVRPRRIIFRLVDSDGLSSLPVIKRLNVVAVNDVPVIGLGGSVGYRAGSNSIVLAPTATVRDPDIHSLARAQLTIAIFQGASSTNLLQISGPFRILEGELLYNGVAIGDVFANGIGRNNLVVRFRDAATIEDVELIVRSIRFKTTATAPLGERLIGFTLTDGDGGISRRAVKTVNVT